MADPRIQRTKNHVLATAGRLLTEDGARRLTYTRVAAEASVSRRTLYVYWPTIEFLIADVFSQREVAETPKTEDSTSSQRLTRFLESVRIGLQDPIENAALLSLLQEASRGKDSDDRLRQIMHARWNFFSSTVGPISADNYALLVGPLFYAQLVQRTQVTDQLIRRQVDFGLSELEELEV